ncbi:MAG TPA: TIGR00730 family Rossman fold protein, partial [Bacteroidetes bacterium]|nr:TIGR00730 family Rossman fold protein [Bacteroidota bacterium]
MSQEEKFFLEGPRSRKKEFFFTIEVLFEFIKGFRAFHFVGPCVTVFGSARFDEDHIYYKTAREIGKRLTEIGFTVMTGGGPGIME